jgi:hypothetical protein
MRQLTFSLSGQCSRFKMIDLCGSSAARVQRTPTGPFHAHLSPKASKRDFLGSGILLLATGAAGDRPPTGLGFDLAARGWGEPGQAAVCLGSPVCEGVRARHRASIDADVDVGWMAAWCC